MGRLFEVDCISVAKLPAAECMDELLSVQAARMIFKSTNEQIACCCPLENSSARVFCVVVFHATAAVHSSRPAQGERQPAHERGVGAENARGHALGVRTGAQPACLRG